MTFYKSVPVVVEAKRFDGSGASGMDILKWLAGYGFKKARLFSDDSNGPAQLDLLIPHVKIAEAGDYIVRMPNPNNAPGHSPTMYRVFTEEHFKATYEHSCPTCTGRVRETVDLVCQTCGHDYAKGF